MDIPYVSLQLYCCAILLRVLVTSYQLPWKRTKSTKVSSKFQFLYIIWKTNSVTYHFHLFVGKFPKLFNFSEGKEKSYLVELNIFKENSFYGLQKILLDNFSRNFYIWSAIVNGACMQKIKMGHWAKFRARFYFRFEQSYAAFNFRWAYFDSFRWRVYLVLDCARACSKKNPFEPPEVHSIVPSLLIPPYVF